jgi:hypothetical protein
MPPLFRCVAYRVETVVIGAAITILLAGPSNVRGRRDAAQSAKFGWPMASVVIGLKVPPSQTAMAAYHFRPPDRFKDRVLRAG